MLIDKLASEYTANYHDTNRQVDIRRVKSLRFTGSGKLDTLGSMYCPNCGAMNEEGAKFCANCGTTLGMTNPGGGEISNPPQPPVTSPPTYQAPNYPAPGYQQSSYPVQPQAGGGNSMLKNIGLGCLIAIVVFFFVGISCTRACFGLRRSHIIRRY